MTVSWQILFAISAAISAVAGVQQAGPPAAKPQNQAVQDNLPPHYLGFNVMPDSLALLPPPPAPGSTAFALDEEISKATTLAADSPRYRLAASDADLRFPHAAGTFACAAGFRPDPQATPVLYRMLMKMLIDIGVSTVKAKNQYRRQRPFVVHGNGTCLPADEAGLRNDWSYPSGHSAVGWGWALMLTEIVPDRTDAILQRGRDFGVSRMVCNAHWASDVQAGRMVGAATVARLHADSVFVADLAQAKSEAMRAPRIDPAGCAAEAAALAMPRPY